MIKNSSDTQRNLLDTLIKSVAQKINSGVQQSTTQDNKPMSQEELERQKALEDARRKYG